MKKIRSYHVGVSAEAFAAAVLARCGYDVSVQYGANQPEYDLIAVSNDRMLKISVKGSQDGCWGLTQGFLKNCDYHHAIEEWLENHHKKTVFCLVQFKDTEIDSMPRIYFAAPEKIAKVLHKEANGRGDTILFENHKWTAKAAGKGTTDKIPDEWKFSIDRIETLFETYGK
ncbi:MAG: hypothetical protein IKQ39_07115 [Oscillospiraceae bacterium]|nr:hypothetical protein [Oscillospiraceae bacterium]